MEALATDLDRLQRVLAPGAGRPLVVHHFATWCDPCEEELPILGGLLEGADARTVAVAWDLFMAPVSPDDAIAACRGFLDRLGVSFDVLCVYTGAPEALFASQGITQGTVPYTDVRDRTGRIVATFPNPLFDDDAQRRFAEALRAAADGGAG